MNNFNFNFAVWIYQDGTQQPNVIINERYFPGLSDLSSGHLSGSKGVSQEIVEIKKVLAGEKSLHAFAGSDWCILDAEKDKTTVISGFDEFESYTVPTEEVLKLMEGWHEFLSLYENGKIPGLTPGTCTNDVTPLG